jgi:hypothetical protein
VVSEKISEVNESVLFASKSALEYAMLFWNMRYYAAFPGEMTSRTLANLDSLLYSNSAKTMDITVLWAGGVALLSEEMSTFMNKYKIEIMMLAARTKSAIAPRAADEGL